MRVLVCASEYFPNGSGIANVAYNVVEQLKKMDIECIICSPSGPDIKIRNLEGKGRLGLIYFWYNVSKYFRNKVDDYDVVWLHYPLFIGKVPFKKCLITVHSTAYGFMHENISPKFYYKLSYVLEKFCLNKFGNKTRFTGVSTKTCKELENILRNGQLIKLIFNGVDTSLFKPTMPKYIFRKKFNIPQDSKVILSVGRIVDHKMPFLMVDIFDQLQKKTSEKYTLVIAGKGKLLDPLKAYSINHNIDNILFLGFIPDNDLPDLYSCSDYFFITSKYEGGEPILTVAEAMSSGLPCIASNIPNFKLIENSNSGIIVDFSNSKKAVESILSFIDGDAFQQSMNARNYTVQNLDWGILASDYLNEFKNIVSE